MKIIFLNIHLIFLFEITFLGNTAKLHVLSASIHYWMNPNWCQRFLSLPFQLKMWLALWAVLHTIWPIFRVQCHAFCNNQQPIDLIREKIIEQLINIIIMNIIFEIFSSSANVSVFVSFWKWGHFAVNRQIRINRNKHQ